MQVNTQPATSNLTLPDDLASRRLLTDVEVAALTGLAVQTLRKQRVRGVGIPYIKLGSSVRYRLSALERYCDAHTVGGAE